MAKVQFGYRTVFSLLFLVEFLWYSLPFFLINNQYTINAESAGLSVLFDTGWREVKYFFHIPPGNTWSDIYLFIAYRLWAHLLRLSFL